MTEEEKIPYEHWILHVKVWKIEYHARDLNLTKPITKLIFTIVGAYLMLQTPSFARYLQRLISIF